MTTENKLYVVTAGEVYYPCAGNYDWVGVVKGEEEALGMANQLTEPDWVAVIEIDMTTLEHRVLRQRQP